MSGRNTRQQWKDKADNFPANCETPMTDVTTIRNARGDYSIGPLEEGQRALLCDSTSRTRSYASVPLGHIFCDIFPTLRIYPHVMAFQNMTQCLTSTAQIVF